MSEAKLESTETSGIEAAAQESLRRMGRRSLLKSLATVGGVAATASLLPSEWVRPVLDLAVLPAHAQLSQQDNVTFLNCEGDVGQTTFYPTCTVTPIRVGISMTLTILINGSEVDSLAALTDAGGQASLIIDPYASYSWNGFDPLILRWSFTNPLNGFGSCEEEFGGDEEIPE
ncbi:MAG: hypothetical protein HQ523_05985 [Lentisphaerae bacterium]|nr:hypothetical protein [Lentisphaerota bacterium]